MRRFTNKIVVITGGTSGIGLAAAKQFIKEGAKVVVTGRSSQSVGDDPSMADIPVPHTQLFSRTITAA
jgi:NAD(P)-dependent dehydrogenase (short-subunit alcohol dehydrogenase family)